MFYLILFNIFRESVVYYIFIWWRSVWSICKIIVNILFLFVFSVMKFLCVCFLIGFLYRINSVCKYRNIIFLGKNISVYFLIENFEVRIIFLFKREGNGR